MTNLVIRYRFLQINIFFFWTSELTISLEEVEAYLQVKDKHYVDCTVLSFCEHVPFFEHLLKQITQEKREVGKIMQLDKLNLHRLWTAYKGDRRAILL